MPRPQQSDSAVVCLWVLTPVAATLALVVVCVAVTTNQWLHTEEKMTNPGYNGTGERDYLSKHTVSGLWTLCFTNPGERDLQCVNIDYFPHEEYSPDPNDSTMAIPYAVTRSAAFFLLATVLLLLAEFCVLAGHCARHRRLCTFVSGVVCIVSGLLMLIGLVMYISIFKAEIGSKLRPRSQLQPPLFTYRYGFSFLLVVAGFMASETAGICAIFLYIYWHQLEWGQKRHDLHRKLSASSALLSPPPPACRRHIHHHHSVPPPPPPHVHAHHHHAHRRLVPPPPPPMHRRYFLEGGGGRCGGSASRLPPPEDRSPPPPPQCLSRSHQDLYYSFPPPFVYHYHRYSQHAEEDCDALPPPLHPHVHPHVHLSSSRSSFFPRDVTTNTVSTTADINSCGGGDDEDDDDDDVVGGGGGGGTEDDDEYSPSIQHEHEFVTFDLDSEPPPRRKDYAFEPLRRTTPV